MADLQSLRRFAPRNLASATPTADCVDHELHEAGYLLWRNAIPDHVVERILRRLNLEIVQARLTAEAIRECAQTTSVPHLRWEPEILSAREQVERLVPPRRGDEWADNQILLRFPDLAAEWPLTSHIDVVPPWAQQRRYRAIIGVALSRSSVHDGCLAIWPGSHGGRTGEPRFVELEAGDVVVMHPDLSHSSTLIGATAFATRCTARVWTASEVLFDANTKSSCRCASAGER